MKRKVSERIEVVMMAVVCVQVYYLSQHAATLGFLLNKVLSRHEIQSSGVLKLFACLKYLLSELGVYGLSD